MFDISKYKMLNIYLTRHGQNRDNLNGILNGHRDGPLTEKGIEQAYELASEIKKTNIIFDNIYSSPLSRALDTASIISTTISGPKPIIEELLIERNFGIMTGKKISDIEALCAPNIIKTELITYFLNPDGAETFPEMMNRAGVLIDKIKNEHKSGNVLLVCHGDIGKMIYAKYYDLDWKNVLAQFHFGNCDLLLLSKESPSSESHVLKIKQYN